MSTASRPIFDAVLRPNRSLSPRGFFWLMVGFGGLCFVTGIGFVTAGAWPIVGFFGLDVLILYIAFKASYRAGNLYETVTLADGELHVRRVYPSGGSRQWRFQSTWLRVDMDDPPEHQSQLTVSSHGRTLAIGAFLTPDERLDLAHALRDALARERASLAPRLSEGPA